MENSSQAKQGFAVNSSGEAEFKEFSTDSGAAASQQVTGNKLPGGRALTVSVAGEPVGYIDDKGRAYDVQTNTWTDPNMGDAPGLHLSPPKRS